MNGWTSDQIDDFVRAVRDLTATVRARTEQFRKLLIAVIAVALLAAFTSVGTVAVGIGNRSIGTTIKNVIDPKGEYAKDAGARTGRLLYHQAEEQDCRARRSLAGLPAPDPGPDPQSPAPCTAQTPGWQQLRAP